MIENPTKTEEFVKAPSSKEYIDTKVPSYHMLEGAYNSFLLGKSEDYEDLREYQAGDNVKDIDWRATARMNEPVIRRFREEKKHDVVFIIDSGTNMLGATPLYERKQLLAVQTAGTLMSIALQHQDTVRVSYIKNGKILNPSATTSSNNLNAALNNINQMPSKERSKETTVPELLDHMCKSLRRKSIIVVISDSYTVSLSERELSLLSQSHHVLWISIEDCLIANFDAEREYVDVQSYDMFPTQIRTDPRVVEALASELEKHNHRASQLLSNSRSNHTSIKGYDSIIPSLYRLLHEGSIERRLS